MSDDRKLEVLRAIVEDFVTTSEPVGSKALVERHHLGVSSATIRNDMAVLEDEGYIVQPHTSAGRIPTDKGYRLFVDRLSHVRALSRAERNAIHAFLDHAIDLDDVMASSVRLLAQLTRQVALVQYPSLTRSAVRHVELVSLGHGRLLLVLIADTGRVEQRVVDVPAHLDEDSIAKLRSALNAAVIGQRFASVSARVSSLPAQFDNVERAAVSAVIATLLETVIERHEERVVFGGTVNLARAGHDLAGTLESVMEALEEQLVLLRLLGEQATDQLPVSVTIGHENTVEGLSSTSVVTAGYGTSGQQMARLGIVGPTRMDYPGTMGAVRAVARYLGRVMDSR
ncbi:MAG: heat-inducible transcriptional repressor HrcA [Actinomycetes bacterium]